MTLGHGTFTVPVKLVHIELNKPVSALIPSSVSPLVLSSSSYIRKPPPTVALEKFAYPCWLYARLRDALRMRPQRFILLATSLCEKRQVILDTCYTAFDDRFGLFLLYILFATLRREI